MTPFEKLTGAIEHQPDLDGKLEALLNGLADRIKATSNDQNIQRLAAELRQAAPGLVRALGQKVGAA